MFCGLKMEKMEMKRNFTNCAKEIKTKICN